MTRLPMALLPRGPCVKLCMSLLATYMVIFIASTLFLGDPVYRWKSTTEFSDPFLVRTKERSTNASSIKGHAKVALHRSKTTTRYITVETNYGRLGNKLFQYASMYGVAMRYNFIPVLKNDETLLSYVQKRHFRAFTVSASDWNKVKWHSWVESHGSSFNKTALQMGLQSKSNILLERYLQSYRYFAGYEAEVVSQFVFSPTVLKWACAVLHNLSARIARIARGRPVTIVGIHIRRGDYLNDDSKSAGYNTPGEDYYVRAVRYFTSRYAFVAFLVSSDDFAWASNFVKRKFESKPKFKKTVFFEFLSDMEEPEKALVTLSLANHSILSAGSFSFWSAMLRQYRTGASDQGTTVYYTKPFIPGTRIGDEYENSTNNYYPPAWIGLD